MSRLSDFVSWLRGKPGPDPEIPVLEAETGPKYEDYTKFPATDDEAVDRANLIIFRNIAAMCGVDVIEYQGFTCAAGSIARINAFDERLSTAVEAGRMFTRLTLGFHEQIFGEARWLDKDVVHALLRRNPAIQHIWTKENEIRLYGLTKDVTALAAELEMLTSPPLAVFNENA